MIFITGGMAQGKTQFAASFGLPIIDDLEQKIKIWLAQGVEIDATLNEVSRSLQGGVQSTTNACAMLDDIVIVCAEIGCGIVPLDKTERIWREETGRTACRLAREAKKVYKLEAGIPIQLK